MAITSGRGLPGDARDYGEEADRWLRGRGATTLPDRARARAARWEGPAATGDRAWSGNLGDTSPSPRWPNLRPISPNEAARFHLELAMIPDDICWLTEDDCY